MNELDEIIEEDVAELKSVYILLNDDGEITHLGTNFMECLDDTGLTCCEIPIEDVDVEKSEDLFDEKLGLAFEYEDGKLKKSEELMLKYAKINSINYLDEQRQRPFKDNPSIENLMKIDAEKSKLEELSNLVNDSETIEEVRMVTWDMDIEEFKYKRMQMRSDINE